MFNKDKDKKIDLAQFKSDDSAVLTLLSPVDGTETCAKLTVASRESQRMRDYIRSQTDIETEDNEARGLEFLVNAIVDWKDVVYDGKDLPCTQVNARMLFTENMWIVEQVNSFMLNRANFMKALQKS